LTKKNKMGFNKTHLPNIEDLKRMVDEWGVEAVLNRFNGPKVEVLIGDVDSMEYLDNLVDGKK
tara:strand:- start:412 stop:600 length:189 start_codon:yes stop_codon:yes gene_type:complete